MSFDSFVVSEKRDGGAASVLKHTWIYIVALVLAALRIAGHKSAAFQAVAHLFMGGLFTASWWQFFSGWKAEVEDSACQKFGLGVALVVIEVAAFFGAHF